MSLFNLSYFTRRHRKLFAQMQAICFFLSPVGTAGCEKDNEDKTMNYLHAYELSQGTADVQFKCKMYCNGLSESETLI